MVEIIIQAGASIEENVTIHARPSGTTLIEENATIGHAAMLHNCTLRKYCVVGMNSTVSDYAEIGEGSIVAEGAVVKGKTIIGPNKIVAGIPAQEIGDVSEKQAAFWKGTNEVYQMLAKDYPKKLKPLNRDSEELLPKNKKNI